MTSTTTPHSTPSVQPQRTYALKKNFVSDVNAHFDAVLEAVGLEYSVCAGKVTSKLVLLSAGVEVPGPLLLGLLLGLKRCSTELRRFANHPVMCGLQSPRRPGSGERHCH